MEKESMVLKSAPGWHSIIQYTNCSHPREVYCPEQFHVRKEQAIQLTRERAAMVYLRHHSKDRFERYVFSRKIESIDRAATIASIRDELERVLSEGRENMNAMVGEIFGGGDDGPGPTVH